MLPRPGYFHARRLNRPHAPGRISSPSARFRRTGVSAPFDVDGPEAFRPNPAECMSVAHSVSNSFAIDRASDPSRARGWYPIGSCAIT